MNPYLRTLLFSSLSLALLVTPTTYAKKLQCERLPDLFGAFISNHYVYRTYTPEIKSRIVEQFIKSIDPSKTLFLEKEVKELRKEMSLMFDAIQRKDCGAFERIHKLIVQKNEAVHKMAKEILGAKYKVNEAAKFIVDPEKREFPKTEDEQKKLVNTSIDFQTVNYLVSENDLTKAKKEIIKRYERAVKRVKDDKAEDLMAVYMEALARSLDPHTSYLSPETFEDFQIQMELSLEGIGAALSSKDGYIVVQEIIPGGSADRSGLLKPEDKIISVAQDKKEPVSLVDMDLRDAVKMIRGKKGTKVHLTVLRKKETVKISLVRDKVDIKEQAAKLHVETSKVGNKEVKVGILDLPSFYGGSRKGSASGYEDVKRLLEEAKKKKVDGLILDLSRNGGGLLQDAVRISGLFIKKGPVVATRDQFRRVEVLEDEDEEIQYSGPLIVLTSRLSASASEILTGALKDYKRALVVGADHTFGKGSVQTLQPLPMGYGAMKTTIAMYYLPMGESVQNRGVDSDVELPSVLKSDEIGEKSFDYALPAMKIDSFYKNEANGSKGSSERYTEVDSSLVKKLQERSSKRVAKDDEFKKIQEELKEAQENQGVVLLSDLKKKSLEKKKDEKEEKKDTAAARRKAVIDTPQMQEAIRIMTDWIEITQGSSVAKK